MPPPESASVSISVKGLCRLLERLCVQCQPLAWARAKLRFPPFLCQFLDHLPQPFLLCLLAWSPRPLKVILLLPWPYACPPCTEAGASGGSRLLCSLRARGSHTSPIEASPGPGQEHCALAVSHSVPASGSGRGTHRVSDCWGGLAPGLPGRREGSRNFYICFVLSSRLAGMTSQTSGGPEPQLFPLAETEAAKEGTAGFGCLTE